MADINKQNGDEKKEKGVSLFGAFLSGLYLTSLFLLITRWLDSARRAKRIDPNAFSQSSPTLSEEEQQQRQALEIKEFFSQHGYYINTVEININREAIIIDLRSRDRAQQLLNFLQDANKFYNGGIDPQCIEMAITRPNLVIIWKEENVERFLAMVDKSKKVKNAYQKAEENKIWEAKSSSAPEASTIQSSEASSSAIAGQVLSSEDDYEIYGTQPDSVASAPAILPSASTSNSPAPQAPSASRPAT